jgi:glucose/arabinose dehydrogenase
VAAGVALMLAWAGRAAAETAYAVEIVADGLRHPWSLAFLPDGALLVTERPGRISVIRQDNNIPVSGVPRVFEDNQSGLFDVVLHPRFAENRLIYLSYVQGRRFSSTLYVARARLDGDALSDLTVIYRVLPLRTSSNQYGGRMAFLPDGTLLVTLGDAMDQREEAQRLGSVLGKIIRLNDDGSVPPDNPFVHMPGARPEIWSRGHRHPQGIHYDSASGRVYATEHGARGGDELNIIEKGANYGWPVASFGRDYSGGGLSPFTRYPGMADAVVVWLPASIAPSGLTVYRGAAFPEWDGDVFVAALKEEHIRRVDMEDGKVAGQEILLGGRGIRVRDVRTGPDGLLYVLDDSNGRILRLTPARGHATATAPRTPALPTPQPRTGR